MATKRKQTETVLGSAEWEIVARHNAYDIRKCPNCGYVGTFPKDMTKCTWRECPNCKTPMTF